MATATDSAAPPWTSAAHPLWRWLLVGAAASNVVPLWSAGHLPFTDLPQHVAAIATLRHWWDPAWKAQQTFTLALSQTQYLLYYLAGALLAVPFGTAERANLVLLSALGAAFPFALRSLLRALRADERLALFGAPLFWSQTLLIGFFNYLAALPLLLWGLALCIRQAERPAAGRGVLLAAAALALFYLHLSAFLFFAPAAALATWLLPRPEPASPEGLAGALLRLPRRLWWLLPSALASLLFLMRSPVMNPAEVGWQAPRTIIYEEPASALRNLPAALLDIWSGPYDEWFLLALLAAAALIAWPGEATAPEEPARAWRRGLAAAWVAWAWALYFFFPQTVGWLWQLNERYAIVAALLSPLLLRPRPGLRGALPLLLVAAVAAGEGGLARSRIRAFDREAAGFDELIARAEPGKRLIGLVPDAGSRVAGFAPFLHYASLYRARSGGVASFSFAELPQSPLRYRPEAEPPRKPAGWEWHPELYRESVDGAWYDYVLVRDRVAAFDPRAPGSHWRLLGSAGRWTLWGK